MQKPKVLVIVGPTASGKTSLSIALAKHFNGEIISADSRQVYRGLNLGTGKVTPSEMSDIPHHLLDVADPRKTYTVADFVHDGRTALNSILSRTALGSPSGCPEGDPRAKLPIVVGGTFFYIDALLGKVSLPEVPPNERLRSELETRSTAELFALLSERDPRRARMIDADNRRRLIRAIEINAAIGNVPLARTEPLYKTLTIGIDIPKDELHANIHHRLLERLAAGMIEEVKNLLANGLSFERMNELGLEYRYISRHLQGSLSYDDMVAELETKIRQFAKRQMTWLKRDDDIIWVNKNDTEKIHTLVSNFLSLNSTIAD